MCWCAWADLNGPTTGLEVQDSILTELQALKDIGGGGQIRTDVCFRRRTCKPLPSTAWVHRRKSLAGTRRIELLTFGFGDRCSAWLSYAPMGKCMSGAAGPIEWSLRNLG